jgi:hypothetical protein
MQEGEGLAWKRAKRRAMAEVPSAHHAERTG